MIEHTTTLAHQSLINRSWERCRQFGLEPSTEPDLQRPQQGELEQLLSEHKSLIDTTGNEVLPYYENILANSQCLILLTDRQGQLLNVWGDKRFLATRHKLCFQTGVNWLEQHNGTNAIGTALATGQAVQVQRDEHYLKANRFMAGSAAPIYDAKRQLIAVLDVSSDSYLPLSHTLGMVKLMSQSIENRLLINAFRQDYFLCTFNTHSDNIDSPWAGLLVFDGSGSIVAANRRSEHILGQSLLLQNIEKIFDQPLQVLQKSNKPSALRALGKYQMFAHIRPPQFSAATRATVRTPAKAIGLDHLEFGDAGVKKTIVQARRVFAKGIPILLYGETGVGKEVFVKALHRQSARQGQPLVAINCAAIPAELVESELFGYEKGAFTGASRQGAMGLIRKANHGTLFLDEIGDMPLKAQARLLRVLQERQVTPLGSTESYPIDIKLISATNLNLKQAISDGSFRQDLYYRINGLNLRLPPLRERDDKEALIRAIHRLNCQGDQPELADDVMDLFMHHRWPGNIRQLVNTIEVALAIADNGEIRPWHLAADFFDDLEQGGGDFSAQDFPHEDVATNHPTDNTVKAYHQSNGNITQAAKMLGISRNTLYKRLKALGVRK